MIRGVGCSHVLRSKI